MDSNGHNPFSHDQSFHGIEIKTEADVFDLHNKYHLYHATIHDGMIYWDPVLHAHAYKYSGTTYYFYSTGAPLTPEVRTNNPTIGTNTVNANISALDKAIGDDADITGPVARTNNPLVVNTTLMSKTNALDATIGADNTPVIRSNNPTVANTTLNAKIQALDTAIGVTPTSAIYISTTDSVNRNLSRLDLVFSTEMKYGTNAVVTLNSAGANSDIYLEFIGGGGAGINVSTVNGAASIVYTAGVSLVITNTFPASATAATIAGLINADINASRFFYATYEGSGAGTVDVIGATAMALPSTSTRTNNPIVQKSTPNFNIERLDQCIGSDPTPVVRTNNPIGAGYVLNTNIDALDAAIGADNTPIVRTNNPTVANTTINAKVDALDAAIGLTPTSTKMISSTNSVNNNLSIVDARLNYNMRWWDPSTETLQSVITALSGTATNPITIMIPAGTFNTTALSATGTLNIKPWVNLRGQGGRGRVTIFTDTPVTMADADIPAGVNRFRMDGIRFETSPVSFLCTTGAHTILAVMDDCPCNSNSPIVTTGNTYGSATTMVNLELRNMNIDKNTNAQMFTLTKLSAWNCTLLGLYFTDSDATFFGCDIGSACNVVNAGVAGGWFEFNGCKIDTMALNDPTSESTLATLCGAGTGNENCQVFGTMHGVTSPNGAANWSKFQPGTYYFCHGDSKLYIKTGIVGDATWTSQT
jgi:hypothetical protein